MLNLNKSKIRRDILFLFFLEKENSYYIRELERILGFSAGNIRRELIALKEEELLILLKKGINLIIILIKNHQYSMKLKA